jgi:hypothetical protein
MKWGVRKKRPAVSATVTKTPGRKVKAQGGTGQKASTDAVTAAKLRQTAKKSSTDSLSNKELQALVQRMNLEQQYDRLRPRSPGEKAVKFVSQVLVSVGKEQATGYARDQVGEAIKKK